MPSIGWVREDAMTNNIRSPPQEGMAFGLRQTCLQIQALQFTNHETWGMLIILLILFLPL